MNGKKLTGWMLAGCVLAGSGGAIAAEQGGSIAPEGAGFGLGAGLGALVAGPPGLVAGAALGGLLGVIQGLDGELHESRAALARVEGERTSGEETGKVATAGGEEPAAMVPVAYQAQPEQPQLAARAVEQGFSLAVQFRTGSAEVEPHYRDQLKALAGGLRLLPGLQVELTAHADPRGSRDENQRLSQARLESVRRLMTEAGIEDERIQGMALGESTPVSAGAEGEAWFFDRRVQIRFRLPDGGSAV